MGYCIFQCSWAGYNVNGFVNRIQRFEFLHIKLNMYIIAENGTALIIDPNYSEDAVVCNIFTGYIIKGVSDIYIKHKDWFDTERADYRILFVFSGKTILITCASSGIGRQTAISLAKLNWSRTLTFVGVRFFVLSSRLAKSIAFSPFL